MPKERFLVSGSDDKTVRVWALEDGRPLATLRVPIGEGNVGEVYAVAISPDGERIAAGGRGPTWEGRRNSIYIFERASGRIVQRIDGLPDGSITWPSRRTGSIWSPACGAQTAFGCTRPRV